MNIETPAHKLTGPELQEAIIKLADKPSKDLTDNEEKILALAPPKPWYCFFMDPRVQYHRFFDKKKLEAVDKWEIWETFKDDGKTMELIMNGKHKRYLNTSTDKQKTGEEIDKEKDTRKK